MSSNTKSNRKRTNDDTIALSQKKVKVSSTPGPGKPFLFDRTLGDNEINRYKNEVSSCSKGFSCAISNAAMSKGKHYVEFQRSGHQYNRVHVGIMRPGLKLDGYESKLYGQGFSPIFDNYEQLLKAKSLTWGGGNVHAVMCLLEPGNKSGTWSDGSSAFDTKKNQREYEPDWGFWEHCPRERVTLGLLLDLDAGSLSVYENGKHLGVLKSGLTGEYCWVVTIVDIEDGTTVRIKKGSVDDGSQPRISDFFKR